MKITKELLEEIGFTPYEIANGFIYKLFYIDVHFDKNYNFDFYTYLGNEVVSENDCYKLIKYLTQAAYDSGRRNLKESILGTIKDL